MCDKLSFMSAEIEKKFLGEDIFKPKPAVFALLQSSGINQHNRQDNHR